MIGETGAVKYLVDMMANPNELLQMQALITLSTLLQYEGNQVC